MAFLWAGAPRSSVEFKGKSMEFALRGGVNAYHLYSAHAAFAGYKKSGIGHETHQMILGYYQQDNRQCAFLFLLNPVIKL